MWETPCSIPGSETPPAEENGNPVQDSFLEDSMDKEPGELQSMGLQKLDTTEQSILSRLLILGATR